jgi:hypothetical protein
MAGYSNICLVLLPGPCEQGVATGRSQSLKGCDAPILSPIVRAMVQIIKDVAGWLHRIQ